MSKFIIKGNSPLSGIIEVKGAKNMATKVISAAILTKDLVKIKNLPRIEDVERALDLSQYLGADFASSKDKLEIQFENISTNQLDADIANKFRASIMFVGPLLARLGEVRFPHPGGCVIGAATRPIDLFLEGYKAMGATIKVSKGYYHLSATHLTGCRYFFTTVSVTGTESLMITATLANGTTTLENCAMEPEIIALAEMLNRMGANISGAGTPTITIKGVKSLKGTQVDIIPDRIETGTFAILGALAKGPLTIEKCNPEHIQILLAIFCKIGVNFSTTKNSITIKPTAKILPYSIKTHEYPGFSTDLQSPYTLLMTQAEGSAIIHETIYDRRLLFVDMLSQMGANIIMCDPHRVVVTGPTRLRGRKLTSPDLRAGITMILAGLIADGQTEIDNIYQVDRGYEDIDSRLIALGAKITRIQ